MCVCGRSPCPLPCPAPLTIWVRAKRIVSFTLWRFVVGGCELLSASYAPPTQPRPHPPDVHCPFSVQSTLSFHTVLSSHAVPALALAGIPSQPDWFSAREALELPVEASTPAQVARDLARASKLCEVLDEDVGIGAPDAAGAPTFANILQSLARAYLSDLQVLVQASLPRTLTPPHPHTPA